MVGGVLSPPGVDEETIVNYLSSYRLAGAPMSKPKPTKTRESGDQAELPGSVPDQALGFDPLALPDGDDLNGVLAQAHQLTAWDDLAAEELDRRHLAWTLTCLQLTVRGPEQAEATLVELLRYFRRLVLPEQEASLDALNRGFRSRWEGFAALLEHQLERWQSRADPGWLLRRPILRTVLECVHATPDMTQASLMDAVNLARERNQEPAIRKAYLSRLLATLEAHGLVVRTRRGREQRVSPGPELRAEALNPMPPRLGLPGPSPSLPSLSQRIAEGRLKFGPSRKELPMHGLDWTLNDGTLLHRADHLSQLNFRDYETSSAPASDPSTDAPTQPVD